LSGAGDDRPDGSTAPTLAALGDPAPCWHSWTFGVLHLMAKRGDVRAVRWLLDRRGGPNAVSSHWDADLTPLHLARRSVISTSYDCCSTLAPTRASATASTTVMAEAGPSTGGFHPPPTGGGRPDARGARKLANDLAASAAVAPIERVAYRTSPWDLIEATLMNLVRSGSRLSHRMLTPLPSHVMSSMWIRVDIDLRTCAARRGCPWDRRPREAGGLLGRPISRFRHHPTWLRETRCTART